MNTADSCLGLILAGGAGRRVGGQDKGWINYQQRPLIQHVVDRLQPQLAEVWISANRNLERYTELGFKLICDQQTQEFDGPLAGITASVQELIEQQPKYPQLECLVVTPCDTPHLPDDFVTRLLSNTSGTPSVAFDGRRQQHLHCMIPKRHWRSLLDFFAAGGRAMHAWLEQESATQIDFSDCSAAFANLNRLSSLPGLS